MKDQLFVKFEGPRISEEGVSLDDLQKTLKHVQTAMRHMVRHLTGYTRRGRPPNWLQRESKLRLIGTSPGSLIVELGLPPSDGYSSTERYGQQAIAMIVGAEGVGSLPREVADELSRIGADLSPEVALVQMGDLEDDRHLEFRREEFDVLAVEIAPSLARTREKALVYGWLKAVDWEARTAKLSRYQRRPVNLRFTADYEQQMLQLATQHVEVRGQGHLDRYDQWRFVEVEAIRGTPSWNEPFDLEAFLNDPNPKIFSSNEIVRADEPFDVDEFIRVIREGRDV